MRICFYVVSHDTGFAPNPFGGFCTLAACTPNHQGLCLKQGDWLVGNSSVAIGSRIIYAMRIFDVLDFDAYYRDSRFTGKKARTGKWQTQCGDNIYFRSDTGRWAQALAFYHTRPGDLEKDTRYPSVFISDHFYYFGENAPAVPPEYVSLIQTRQGCRCCKDLETACGFIGWLEQAYAPGLHGQPRDRNEIPAYSESPCLDETKEVCRPNPRRRTRHRDDGASSVDCSR
jgi:hypothetical protein